MRGTQVTAQKPICRRARVGLEYRDLGGDGSLCYGALEQRDGLVVFRRNRQVKCRLAILLAKHLEMRRRHKPSQPLLPLSRPQHP
jgi:hypothetical protein